MLLLCEVWNRYRPKFSTSLVTYDKNKLYSSKINTLCAPKQNFRIAGRNCVMTDAWLTPGHRITSDFVTKICHIENSRLCELRCNILKVYFQNVMRE
jgi:hypothetical protein